MKSVDWADLKVHTADAESVNETLQDAALGFHYRRGKEENADRRWDDDE